MKQVGLFKILFKNLFVYFLLLIGLLIFFYPIFFVNSTMLPGDLGDARFVNYTLEHGWLWMCKSGVHQSFWNMPFFYPYENTLAFSDILLGGMIVYAPIRFFVENPQTALQIWLITVCILNYFSCYLLMRKCFKFNYMQSAAAAFLFAFALPRHVQIGHLQLYLQFYMMFSLCAFLSINEMNSKLKNNLLFLAGALMFVIQLYTSFYFGWFMVFGAVVFALCCLSFSKQRGWIINLVKKYRIEILSYAILSFLLLIPLISHYIAVGSEFRWTSIYLFKFFSFLSSESLLDRYIWKNPFKCSFEAFSGIGYFTTILVFVGLYRIEKYRKLIFLFIGVVVLLFWSKDFNHTLYNIFPGASAIRAGGRVIFLLLPVFAYGLANYLKTTKSKAVIWLVIALVAVEQIPFKSGFNWAKDEHAKRVSHYEIPANCEVVFYEVKVEPDYVYNIDIMWAASNKSIYTVNGFSGYMPPVKPSMAPKACRFEIKDPF